MKTRDILQRFSTKLVLRGFRVRDFNAVFGVRHAAALAALLEADDSSTLYRNVYGLHNLRWMMFDPNEQNDVVSIDPTRRQALVLSLVFDGNLADVLEALIDQVGPRLYEILSQCFGFDANTGLLSFIEQHATPSEYLFRDLGPLLLPAAAAPSAAAPSAASAPLTAASRPVWLAELSGFIDAIRSNVAYELSDDTPPPEPDPTRAEIEDAHALQRRFERFYALSAEADPAALRDSFAREFADAGFPFPLTRYERPSYGEESWTRRMVDVAHKLQERTARRSNDRAMRRGAHAKSHGFLHADFEVLSTGLPGLFAEAKTYEAVLRPSNGFSGVKPDESADARGLALGVMVPADQPIAGRLPSFLLPLARQGHGRQDFVLMNQPVFVAPDLTRFALLFKTFNTDRLRDKVLGLMALATLPGGARQLGIVARTTFKRVSHPLNAAFHSTTPYLLGEQRVAKYSLDLDELDSKRLRHLANPRDPNSLSFALTASLRDKPLRMKLFVHVFQSSDIPKGLTSLSDAVEDATLDWRKLGAERIQVANVTIGPQDPATRERLAEAEAARFNPWNALVEHRPLGSLNRARLTAYGASQRLRSAKLAQPTPLILAHAAE